MYYVTSIKNTIQRRFQLKLIIHLIIRILSFHFVCQTCLHELVYMYVARSGIHVYAYNVLESLTKSLITSVPLVLTCTSLSLTPATKTRALKLRLLALETMSLFSWLEHLVFTVFVICIVNIWYSEGLQGVLSVIIKVSHSDVYFSIVHVDSSLFHFRRKFLLFLCIFRL